MKKLSLMLAAALALSLWSCNEKEENISEIPPTENVTEETADTPFRELSDEDFYNIDVNLNITDDAPPFELHSYDLRELDFGARLSPCKAEDVRDNYGMKITSDDENEQARIDREREELCNTPYGGRIEYTAFLDGDVYFSVDFDDLCGEHDSALFRYELDSGELTELAERRGLEHNGRIDQLCTAGGKLLFACNGDDGDITSENAVIMEIDPATGEMSELIELPYRSVGYLVPLNDTLFVDCYTYNSEVESYDNVIGEYSLDTGELVKEYNDMTYMPFLDGSHAEVSGGLNETFSVKTDYYQLDTALKRISKSFLWRDKVSLLADESVGSASERRLYTYDFTSMERTKLNLNGFGGGYFQAGSGIVIITGSASFFDPPHTVYYIQPEIGTAFRLAKAASVAAGESDGVFYILTSGVENSSEIMFSEEGASPETLYWFEV